MQTNEFGQQTGITESVDFINIIYDYARGAKQKMRIKTEEYKTGYNLITYKEVKGHPYATLVGGVKDGKFYIGISCCSIIKDVLISSATKVDSDDGDELTEFECKLVKEGDIFSKAEGKQLAIENLYLDEVQVNKYFTTMPRKIIPQLTSFYLRCIKYYKDAVPAYDYPQIAVSWVKESSCEDKSFCKCEECTC